MGNSIVKEEKTPENRLLVAVESLRALHEDICETEHSLIERGKTYMPYEPTFFLYNFFAFNTIFNINWDESRKEGVVIEQKKGSESDRINHLIHFCFDSKAFWDPFWETFVEIVTAKYSVQRIVGSLENIDPTGGKIDEDVTQSFKSACKLVLTKQGFTEENLKNVFSFIYKVRCNIVHGTKSMRHMENEQQRARIQIYSYFIIGLLHMLFMRLEFESDGFYNRSMSESFIQRLRQKSPRIQSVS